MTLASISHAASFVIRDGETVTVQQLLDGDGETGIIEVGGVLQTGAVRAVSMDGNGISVNNGGSIGTEGSFADGIASNGDKANITNSGSVGTEGDFSEGIVSFGDNDTITNSGSIGTEGSGAEGIDARGDKANITNSGGIRTEGDGTYGIRSFGRNATISNSGRIRTQGVAAEGIFSLGDSATIANSGSIGTEGVAAEGIFSLGDSATIANSGSIGTEGIGAEGIDARGDKANITNSGGIRTEGDGTHGISSLGRNATITNSGSIRTKGDRAHGIFTGGEYATISNSGSIRTQGDSAYGIRSFGRNATISNSGLISATGRGSVAIRGYISTQTVIVQPGSRIMGPIDLGGDADADVANIYGSFGSAVLTFENTETIKLFAPNALRIDGTDTVVMIDPIGEFVLGNTLNALATGVHNVISRRMQHTAAIKPLQLASLKLSPGMLYQERAPVTWGQFFGRNSSRDGEGRTLDYDHDYRGFVGGYERDYDGRRMGLLAGVARADTDSDMMGRDTDSIFLGVYGHAYFGNVNLTASLLAGLEDHDTKRRVLDNVNGYETARSDRDSGFLSPSITLSSAYTLEPGVELRPSATLTYAVGWYDDYQEAGTTNANLDVDSRTVDALGTRLQLEWAKIIEGGEMSLRVGARSRHTGGDDIAGNLDAANFKYKAASGRDVTGGFVGVGAQQELKDKLNLFADLEYGRFSDDEDYLAGQVTLEYRF